MVLDALHCQLLMQEMEEDEALQFLTKMLDVQELVRPESI